MPQRPETVLGPDARRITELEHEVVGLTIALHTRDVIGQAKGVLISHYGLDDTGAFALLRRVSQDTNTKLVDVAASLVERGIEEEHDRPPRQGPSLRHRRRESRRPTSLAVRTGNTQGWARWPWCRSRPAIGSGIVSMGRAAGPSVVAIGGRRLSPYARTHQVGARKMHANGKKGDG